jgi:hypothetical protein
VIALEQAEAVASEWVRSLSYNVPGDELTLVHNATIERPFGWVFFYSSKRWLAGDLRFALAGNAPILIDRRDGQVRVAGTEFPIEHYLRNYEATGDPNTTPGS